MFRILLALALLATVFVSPVAVMIKMPGRSHSGEAPAFSVEERELSDHLRKHVATLAVSERNLWRPGSLEAAAGYISQMLSSFGYSVREQVLVSRGERVKNLEVELPGNAEIVVIGAHYDTVYDCPGANDNASGVAALLELSRMLKRWRPKQTLRFVAFVNEEMPFFATGEMGSQQYASLAKKHGEQISAMVSLETIGYYSEEAGSQHYPAPLHLFYPKQGNFIGFVGNVTSRALVRRAIASFRAAVPFPSEGAAIPSGIPGVSWSDHASFWAHGYSAIMVTDTAPYRYPYYHTPQDTADKLDYERMARVVFGLKAVVQDLANR
jgi:Zn-dependent M28 family amino/carboxypeptidase